MFMPSCKDVSRLVSESMDRDLPFRQRFSHAPALADVLALVLVPPPGRFLRDAAHAFGETGEEGELLANVRQSPEARAPHQQPLEHNGQ